MDNKRTLVVMLLVVGLVMGWQGFLAYYRHNHPEYNWDAQTDQPQQADATTQPATSPATTSYATTQGGTTMPAGNASVGPAPDTLAVAPAPADGGKQVQLGSATPNDGNYSVALNLTPEGAALDSVVLNQFKQTVDGDQRYTFQQPYPGHEGDTRPLATRTLTINGRDVDLTNVRWNLESQSAGAGEATYGVTINDAAGKPVAHVTKTYTVAPDASKGDDRDAGYEVGVDLKVRNLTGAPMTAKVGFNGPTMPPKEIERGLDRNAIAGFDQGDQEVVAGHHAIDEFKPGKDTQDLHANANGHPFLWAGAASVYFDAIVRPETASQIEGVVAKALNPEAEVDDRLVGINFQSAELKAGPERTADLPLKVFFGPKKRSLLGGAYYSQYPRGYNTTLLTTGGICGYCSFAWMMNLLVYLLQGFHFVLRDWGLAIIGLVVIVRLILHPLTKRSQVSMSKMQKLSPEMERLKKKYGDDKEGFAKAQMELYKDVGFTPLFGCAPMFLQMPIWIALYNVLQTEFLLRQAPFLHIGNMHLTWIHDLAKPDALISWSHPFVIPFLGWHVQAFNLLPILMAIVTFINQKYFMPRPAAATPEQEQQQKMMLYMTLLFPLMFYSLPSGLLLYYVTSTTLGILESKRIRDHIRERDEAEKAGKVIVDAKPTRGNRRKDDDRGGPGGPGGGGGKRGATPPKPAGGIGSWLGQKMAELQAKAEELKREAEQRDRGKGKA